MRRIVSIFLYFVFQRKSWLKFHILGGKCNQNLHKLNQKQVKLYVRDLQIENTTNFKY